MTEPAELEIRQSPDFQVIFANQSRMRLGFGEISLTFAFQDDLPGTGVVNEEKATIVLTPHHAKVLAKSLKEVIKHYERHYGKIPLNIPPPPPLESLITDIQRAATQDD